MATGTGVEAPFFEPLAWQAETLSQTALLEAFRAANVAVALTYLSEQPDLPDVIAARERYGSAADQLGLQLAYRASHRRAA